MLPGNVRLWGRAVGSPPSMPAVALLNPRKNGGRVPPVLDLCNPSTCSMKKGFFLCMTGNVMPATNSNPAVTTAIRCQEEIRGRALVCQIPGQRDSHTGNQLSVKNPKSIGNADMLGCWRPCGPSVAMRRRLSGNAGSHAAKPSQSPHLQPHRKPIAKQDAAPGWLISSPR